MKRIMGTIIGIFFILFGGANWVYGISMKFFYYCLVGVGAVTLLATVIAVGIVYVSESPRNPKGLLLMSLILSIFGAADVCAETIHAGTLTPPDKWPVMQWNPNAATGAEVWAYVTGVLLLGVAIALLYHFGWNWMFRNRDSSWRSW